jgi:hypothetical protein
MVPFGQLGKMRIRQLKPVQRGGSFGEGVGQFVRGVCGHSALLCLTTPA